MKRRISQNYVLRAALLLAAAAIVTLAGLRAITRYDNKYIAKAPLTQGAFAQIPEKGFCSLVDGWLLYPDALLSPADFVSHTEPAYLTWAGEYPNLSSFHADKNPYGTATYRLRLQGEGIATLYLPELPCASRVYVNGQYLGKTGEVSPESYTPLIRDSFYSFPLGKDTELLIQTANYSHYYGGIWFVPVIGSPDSISRLVSSRMLLYGLLFSVSLTLSLFCLVLWKREKSATAPALFYFGMMCLCFALRICYPFFRLLGLPSVRILYALEDTASLFCLYFSLRIVLLLFLPDSFCRIGGLLHALSLGVCAAGVVVPLFVIPSLPGIVTVYGPAMSLYKAFLSCLFISLTVYGSLAGTSHAGVILAASAANGICQLSSVLSIGKYEPFVGAYPEEYGVFCMVIAFSVLMARRSRDMALENQRLHLHLQEEVQEKTDHLQKLLSERSQLISELGHDMKSPLTSLSNMAQIIRLNDIMLDEDTRGRMVQIEEQCSILSERLRAIQEIASASAAPMQTSPLELRSFLSEFNRSCRPVIELYGPNLTEDITSKPCLVMANREQLFRALENLLYNAADFTPPEGDILLSLTADKSRAYITVSDTGCGISEEDLPHIFHRSYTTRADKGGQGLGLAITHAIISEHGGTVEVSSEKGKGTTFTISLPLL